MHSVQLKITILLLNYSFEIDFFSIWFLINNDSLFCIDIKIILILNILNCFPTKQYNNMLGLCIVN